MRPTNWKSATQHHGRIVKCPRMSFTLRQESNHFSVSRTVMSTLASGRRAASVGAKRFMGKSSVHVKPPASTRASSASAGAASGRARAAATHASACPSSIMDRVS